MRTGGGEGFDLGNFFIVLLRNDADGARWQGEATKYHLYSSEFPRTETLIVRWLRLPRDRE